MALKLVEEDKEGTQKSSSEQSPGSTESDSTKTIPSQAAETEAPLNPVNESVLAAKSPPEKPPKKSLRFKLTITFLCLVSLVASIDAVIVAACLAAIADDLGGNSVKTFWIGTSFLLAQTVTIPIYGTLSEIFGRRWLLLSAIALFLLGSILCATARSIDWLIGARVVQGLGAGGTLNLVSVIISDITEMRERGLYLSLGGLSWAIGTNIAVPLGGAIAGNTTWRWVFWINLPLGVVPLVGLYFTLNLKKDISSFESKLARIDYLGISIFTAASCSFLVGITTGGTVYPWSSSNVLAPLIIGLALYVAFVIIEWKFHEEPMIPLRVFNDRSAATAGFFTAFAHGLVLWCNTYYMIVFFLGALQHGRFHSALETLPGTAFTAPSAIVAGLVAKRFLRFRPQIWSGWALVSLGMGLTMLMQPNSSAGILYGLRIFSSVGGGLLFPTPVFAAQVNQRNQDVGIATSLIAFFRSLGQAFGVAIGGVIFQNQWETEMVKWVSKGVIPQKLVLDGNTAEVAYGIIRAYPENVQGAYRWIYSDSLRMVWAIMTAISGVSFLIVLLSRNESLDKGHSSTQTFEEKEKTSEKSMEVGL